MRESLDEVIPVIDDFFQTHFPFPEKSVPWGFGVLGFWGFGGLMFEV